MVPEKVGVPVFAVTTTTDHVPTFILYEAIADFTLSPQLQQSHKLANCLHSFYITTSILTTTTLLPLVQVDEDLQM